MIIISFFVLLISFGLFFSFKFSKKEYNKQFSNLDANISITIFTEKNGKKITKKVESIYQKYEKLISREKAYEGINNLYYLIYNNSKEEYITLDKELYDLIYYGKKWYKKSNGLIDISIGNITNIWDMYIDSKSGYPSDFEIERANTDHIDEIILEKNNKIKNNHVNINLDYISKSYVTQEVINYLKKQHISDYKITVDNNMYVGNKKDGYKIAIANPIDDSFTIIKSKNVGINNRYNSDNSYIYLKKLYNNLINPKTGKQSNYMKGVTVISDDIKNSDAVSLMLYLMCVEDGKKYVENNDIEAIWYTNDNQLIKSSGIAKYN